MKKHLILAATLLFTSFAMNSCLKFDNPGDEFGLGDIIVPENNNTENKPENEVQRPGEFDTLIEEETPADVLNYYEEYPIEEVAAAAGYLDPLFRQAMSGRYNIRGGKEGGYPAEHAYQRQYSLGPDTYAQYFTVPHSDFMYGKKTSTYDLTTDFNGDPLGAYTMAKNSIIPLLNDPEMNKIPEIKAINLLFYCIIAQEQADLAGPYTYFEDKRGVEDPRVYINVRSIYNAIVKNIDNIVACLQNYEYRSDEYKNIVTGILGAYHDTNPAFYLEGDTSFDTYIKLANSLKLRMAMHIVKVDAVTARKWAEEAVASGVIERELDQHALYPMFSGFAHPLLGVFGWGDLVLSASFESLLMSLNHPYVDYVFENNNNVIINDETFEKMPAGTRLCGLREGFLVGTGQDYAVNQLQAFSKINTQTFTDALIPLYFIKWAEVDLLRAEGALRGWSMGGTAQFFYERAIENAYLECPFEGFPDVFPYKTLVGDYMAQESAADYTYIDPTGNTEDLESTTKIGVKWNDNDTQETKLEKIITQKYIALFPLSTEAWTELRRTGYPKLFPVLNPEDGDGSLVEGDIIRRIPWAPTEDRIQAIVNEFGLPALGGADLQATRLWWDVDKANF